MRSEPRIAVVGTGANGASIGADLIRAGLDVTFIEQWPAHVEAMTTHGLRVDCAGVSELTWPDVRQLCEVATIRDQFDVVFLLVKAYDTRWACELIAPLLAPDGALVGLQNGMTLPDIESIVGDGRAVGAVIEVGSAMFEPGVVERHTPRDKCWFALGGLNATSQAKAAEIAPLLSHAGRVDVVEDIHSAKWMKLIVNAGELVPSAIVNLSMRAAIETAGLRDVMRGAALEAVDAARLDRAQMVPILGMDDLDLNDPVAFIDGLLDKVIYHFALPHTLTTVLQDWMKGRRSEVLEINGLVVDVTARHRKRAPFNEATVDLALLIEAGLLAMKPDNLEQYLTACGIRGGDQHA